MRLKLGQDVLCASEYNLIFLRYFRIASSSLTPIMHANATAPPARMSEMKCTCVPTVMLLDLLEGWPINGMGG